jgi:hypothetical protein
MELMLMVVMVVMVVMVMLVVMVLLLIVIKTSTELILQHASCLPEQTAA